MRRLISVGEPNVEALNFQPEPPAPILVQFPRIQDDLLALSRQDAFLLMLRLGQALAVLDRNYALTAVEATRLGVERVAQAVAP